MEQQQNQTQQQQQQQQNKIENQIYELKKQQELRFEVEFDVKGTIKLIEGSAEYFGTELSLGKTYKVTSSKGAIFTWSGCKIEVSGNVVSYIGQETPMLLYAGIHKIIDDKRTEILDKPSESGPRVIIVGPTDAGKSSLSKMLMGYSCREGYQPVFVDLDPGQGSITLPGTICASLIDKPIDIEEGLSNSVPFVLYYGHTSLDVNPSLFKAMIASLASNVERRLETSEIARASGFIVNTCGWIDGLGYQILLDSIQTLKANIIVVMDNEKLYSDLANQFSSGGVVVKKLPKSGGVFLRSPVFRKKTRMSKIREYFYGINGDLCPHNVVIEFKDVVIYRTGGGPQAPMSALPIGTQSQIDPLQLSEVSPNPDIIHSILAISYTKQPQNILKSNVAGFLYVTEVNMETKKITALAPCSGPIPSKYLLLGTLKWLE
ncbi:hypothetical protein DLAC_08495 [Tieghemostelium lacteum]|uniref:Protein CLP1 homolog n=1 Tax=Tieghemostelium lacteum TaxID=361077 RepID=A0A151Z7I4_TIELA|nr:hypothetical protein DLAC_08495 [Tieghemostelium lacteum]|eukprot:KYQ89926.1 hypothetical protein DLAC_08495 [Tieghemostelium lacteum]